MKKIAEISVENIKPRALTMILETIQDSQQTFNGNDHELRMQMLANKTLGVYRAW